MWREERVRENAAALHGLITRPTLMSLGCTDHEIAWRVDTNRLLEVHAGVYDANVTPRTWRANVLAAALAAGEGAVASHRTAVMLWELEGLKTHIIELTVPFTSEPEPAGAIVHRTRRAIDARIVDAIPAMAVERTILDVAPYVPDRTLEKLIRSAIYTNRTTVDQLSAGLRLWGGRGVRGTRRVRRVLSIAGDDKTASVAEVDLNVIVRDAPIPRAVQQLQIVRPGGENAYPDFSWPDRMRIVEVDGYGAHSTPEQLAADLSRQNDLFDLGWEIRRFTATEIRESPARVRDAVVRFVNKPFRATRSVRVSSD
jgi:very-short-patch-repair endonuclease